MKQVLRNIPLLLTLLVGLTLAGCGLHDDHVATANVEIKLSDAVAKVADMKIVYDLLNQVDTDYSSKTFSKTFKGTMAKNESDNFLNIFVYLDLKDDYRETIKKMSSSELITFYNHCSFLSKLKVEIDDEPALNTEISGNCNEVPEDGIITADRIIETLEQHSDPSRPSIPLFMIIIEKKGSTWKQSGWVDPWCEKITVRPIN